jgi:hypothetical protein
MPSLFDIMNTKVMILNSYLEIGRPGIVSCNYMHIKHGK